MTMLNSRSWKYFEVKHMSIQLQAIGAYKPCMSQQLVAE